jgi:hypothetical protein
MQLNTVGTHKTTVSQKDSVLSVVYHWTEVVKVTPKEIILDTNGWWTNTTKARMNQASNQFDLGFRVYQKNFEWFVEYKGKTIHFNNPTLTLIK